MLSDKISCFILDSESLKSDISNVKKVYKILVLLAIIILIINIESKFKNSEFFTIQNVELNKVSPELNKNLLKLKEELIGKNINSIDLNQLKNKLLKDPRIVVADIYVRNLSDIHIQVKEATSFYYLQYQNRMYTADKNGNIFGKLEEYPRESLPILCINKDSEKKSLLKVSNILTEAGLNDEVSQLYLQDKDTIIVLLKNGVKLKTNEEATKEKYIKANTLYTGFKGEKDIEYIDIRFKDMVVKEKEKVDGQQDNK